jgi:hypothetical protein
MTVTTIRKITFKQSIGCGRYYVLMDGVTVGEVLKLRKLGQLYWKIAGTNEYYGTRDRAAAALISR